MQPNSATSFKVGCAIDFETSGYQPWLSCALGLTKIEDYHLTDSYYTLLKPESDRVFFTNVHGLTWSDLKDAPTLEQVWPDICNFLTGVDFFLAHNAPFDRKVYYASLDFFRLEPVKLPFLCTLKGSRAALKGLPSKSLDSVCQHFNIGLIHHHAGSDAKACAEIYLRLHDLGITDAQMRLRDI